MNKNQITMAAIGGTALAAALAVGFFAFTSFGEKGERESDLEGRRAEIANLRNAAVSPCEESVKKIDANGMVVAAWREKAFDIASQGDTLVDAGATPAAFKQRMVEDARDLMKLPGSVEGRISSADQGFGFKDFIRGGAMPTAQELPVLQRQWSEVVSFVNTLSECGVAELLGVVPQARAAEQAEQPGARNKRGGRGQQKTEAKSADGSGIASAQRYKLTFKATPAAFVRVVNAFAASSRFTVVEKFGFTREDDALSRAIGVGKDKKAENSRSGRFHSARSGSKKEEGEAVKKGLVTDPAAVLLNVSLDVVTYDFGSASAKSATAAKDEKKEESK